MGSLERPIKLAAGIAGEKREWGRERDRKGRERKERESKRECVRGWIGKGRKESGIWAILKRLTLSLSLSKRIHFEFGERRERGREGRESKGRERERNHLGLVCFALSLLYLGLYTKPERSRGREKEWRDGGERLV